jgi:hypothetical protein
MNPETELFLIAFVSGAATMLLILFPFWIRYDRNVNIQKLKDTAEAFDRGYDLARKQGELKPYSTLANLDQLP